DEVFHIPQAQRYCNGDFVTYDPKLTTPPGLYVVSYGVRKIISLVSGFDIGCSVFTLRSINMVFGLGTCFVIQGIMNKVHGTQRHHAFHALSIFLFPVSFFFHFLYYTDSGSTFFILWSLLLAYRKKTLLSGFASLVALTFRQTNIVWSCFIAGYSLESRAFFFIEPISFFLTLIRDVWDLKVQILSDVWPFVGNVLLFVTFVKYNGGVALGDKENHVASIHAAQVLYFSAFLYAFTFIATDPIKNLRKAGSIVVGILKSLASLGLVVHKFTVEHPFLLADNRHYTFYIWRYLFRSHWAIRFALIPGYILSIAACVSQIVESQDMLWFFLFTGATLATLIPSPLLEFRYFIIPFLIYRIHLRPAKKGWLLIEALLFVLFNAATIYLFTQHTFEWPQAPNEKQRFMY
ncbi:alpha-2-glucosyltransferase Alg10, partial [Chytridium lagenaria]